MSLNLTNASANVRARVALVVGGAQNVHVTRTPPGWTPPTDEFGRMSPYAVINFGEPVPDYGRTIADGEGDYPHTWPVSVLIYCATGDETIPLGNALRARMIDFSPDGSNSTPFRGGASYSYPVGSQDNIPARIEMARYYTCLVNMSGGSS